MIKIDSTLAELLITLMTTKRTMKSSRDIILAIEWASTTKKKSSWKKKKKQ